MAGAVEDRVAFLSRVRDALAADLLLPTALAKIVPVDTTLRFEPADPLPTLANAVVVVCGYLAAASLIWGFADA